MIANFLHTKFTFVYIYIIFMLHFVKNEDEVKMSITFEGKEIKFGVSLDTTTEGGKKFYELLKEKKKMELPFSLSREKLYTSFNKNFELNDENTEIPSIETLPPLYIFVDQYGLGISLNPLGNNPLSPGVAIITGIEVMEIGYLTVSAPSYYELRLLIMNYTSKGYEEPLSIEFALNSNNNYNVDLLLLISSIIIIILLFVCLLSFLTK